MVIDEILAYNEQFVQENRLPIIGHTPRKRMAVVTCMDCRLVQMFELALGLERGDVIEVRTAGATISESEREGGLSDLIRSLAGGIFLLRARRPHLRAGEEIRRRRREVLILGMGKVVKDSDRTTNGWCHHFRT